MKKDNIPMNIMDNIRTQSEHLTKKQRKVADYMLEHPDEMGYITLKELSQKLGVTEITILNTCTSLGYEGYNMVKYEFRKVMIMKKIDVLEDKENYLEKVPRYEQDNREKVFYEIGDEEIKSITDYWNHVKSEQYFEAAQQFLKSKQIFLCGRGISFCVAEFLKNRLSSCDMLGILVNTELNDEVYSMLNVVTEDSLVVAISFPDYYFVTDKVAEYSRQKNAKIVAITDRVDANVAQYADVTLAAPAMTRIFLNTLTGPMLMLNLLTSAIKLQQGKTDLETEKIL